MVVGDVLAFCGCLQGRTGKCKRFLRAAKEMGSSCAPAASEIKGN